METTYTPEQVEKILEIQRSMIANDLRMFCGKDLTDRMKEIIRDPRKPNYLISNET
jgi:hypothetical protein